MRAHRTSIQGIFYANIQVVIDIVSAIGRKCVGPQHGGGRNIGKVIRINAIRKISIEGELLEQIECVS